MGSYTRRRKVTHGLLTGLLVAGTCLVLTARPASPGESQLAPDGTTQTGSGGSVPLQPGDKPAGPRGAPDIMIHIDPKTGTLVREPVPGVRPLVLTPAERNAFDTSDQGLVEAPSSVPGGGVTLDLQGRFQSPLFATIDAEGRVKVEHLHEVQETGDQR